MRWPRPTPLVGDQTSAALRRKNPAAWRFSDADRAAIYRVIEGRRDVRRFRPDDIDDDLMERLLLAAHRAPSVGHSQSWRFVVVRDVTIRERAAALADRERLRQASLLDHDAAQRLLDLQLDGLREAPVGVVVACDRRVEPSRVLGRATFHDADQWSCACAIENLWLAARGEGVGVGWVTLFRPDDLSELVGLPAGVEPMGWLCVGWPDERSPVPSLERSGWSQRLGLYEVVLAERWSSATIPAPRGVALRGPDAAAVVHARDDRDELLSAPGSLGRLDLALDSAASLGLTADSPTTLVLCGADHPVTNYGVSTYDAAVTREILDASIAGVSLGVSVARATGADVKIVDAGVSGVGSGAALDARPHFERGDLIHADALVRADVERLVQRGREIGESLARRSVVALGEFGIGNTTVAAALGAALLGVESDEMVGLGVGGDSPTLSRKAAVASKALERFHREHPGASLDPMCALGALGGGEVAVLVGVILGAASAGSLVVMDGLVTSVSALVATRLEPATRRYLLAGQRSRERAHELVLTELGLEPLLEWRLRAGEGVGALFAAQALLTGLAVRALVARVDS